MESDNQIIDNVNMLLKQLSNLTHSNVLLTLHGESYTPDIEKIIGRLLTSTRKAMTLFPQMTIDETVCGSILTGLLIGAYLTHKGLLRLDFSAIDEVEIQ